MDRMDRDEKLRRTEARRDFLQARWLASLETLTARFTGKSAELLAFDEVAEKLREVGRTSRGVRQIPVGAIVGSVGRTNDFTRTFLPRLEEDESRWVRVHAAAPHIGDLPPIEVYQIGDAYFVSDGNHRVSIARRQGITFLDAHVTEVRTRIPLTADVQPDDLIIMAEHAAFLERTRLDELRPGADFRVSVPGQYSHLENLIEVHRYFQEIVEGRNISDQEAVAHWYDTAYLPMVIAIREQGILRYFPGRTETDFYVWLATHRKLLEHQLGWPIRPEVAVSRLLERIQPQEKPVLRISNAVLNLVIHRPWPSTVAAEAWNREHAIARYSSRLFADVLVPLAWHPTPGRPPIASHSSTADNPAVGWSALALAIAIAKTEASRLFGLLFLPPNETENDTLIPAVRQHFEQHCQQHGVEGILAVEWGNVVERICDRTALLDLVVLGRDFHYEGGAQLPTPIRSQKKATGSQLELFVRRSCRPILLAALGQRSLPRHALLLYDNQPQSQEALFLAAYLAEQWQTRLTVITFDNGRSANRSGRSDNEQHAHQYLALHEVEASFYQPIRSTAEVTEVTAQLYQAAAQGCDLIILGGYPRKGGFRRSRGRPRTPLLNHLLANWSQTMLICP